MNDKPSFVLKDSGYAWFHRNATTHRLYSIVEGHTLPPDTLVYVDTKGEPPPMGQVIQARIHSQIQAVCTPPFPDDAGLVVLPIFILTDYTYARGVDAWTSVKEINDRTSEEPTIMRK